MISINNKNKTTLRNLFLARKKNSTDKYKFKNYERKMCSTFRYEKAIRYNLNPQGML